MFLILICSLQIEFDYTAGLFLDQDRTTEMRISYAIPRRELTFTKSGDFFLARFRVLCSLRQGDREIGDTWIVEDTLGDYASTSSKQMLRGELRLHAPSGDHKLRIGISDLNSQRSGEKERKMTIKEPGNQDQISDLIHYLQESDVILSFEVYRFSGTPFQVVYEIGAIKDSLSFDGQSFINPVTLKLPRDSLGFGDHEINISVGDSEKHSSIHVETPFWKKDFEKRVRQLRYIATSQETDSLLEMPVDKREQLWEEFWAKKGKIYGIRADELQETYFNRIDYANEHFSTFREGWQTDRGRIHAKLGTPDEKANHPFEVDQPPYEVWYYYSWDVKFVFVDSQGFGNYALEYPRLWDEEIRFR
jgi:GWxTD domain-containing protein